MFRELPKYELLWANEVSPFDDVSNDARNHPKYGLKLQSLWQTP